MNERSDGTAPGGERPPWKLIGPLLAVHAVIALGTMCSFAWQPRGVFPETLIVSLVSSQGSLVGMWAAFGGPARPWRLLITTLAALGWAWLLEEAFPESDARYWGYFLFAQTVGTSLPLVGLRFCGLAIARHKPGDSAPEMQKLQFSLRALLAWTTALAALMGIVQMMPREFRETFTSPEQVLPACGMFAALAMLAVGALWIALGTRWPVARVAMFGLAAIAAVVGISALLHSPGALVILALPFLCGLWLVGSLWPFRVLGYGLAWRRSVRL